MSTPRTASAVAHGEAHHPAGTHYTLRGYLTGFVLSVVLTAVPFALVMGSPIESKTATALIIMAFAVAQIFVHMVFFLHMDAKSESGWSLMALIFTLILVAIGLTGSLWVMYHLNANMMPSLHDMREMP
jgi:cytochrome o ubiquinol oxidase operon protein cyoD